MRERVESPVPSPLLLLVLSVLIFGVLTQMSGIAAAIFLVAALIVLPTISIHRREQASMPERGYEQESHARGVLRLGHVLTQDMIGIATGTLAFVLVILFIRLVALKAGH